MLLPCIFLKKPSHARQLQLCMPAGTCRDEGLTASLDSTVEELLPQLQQAQQHCSRLQDEAHHQQQLQSDLRQQVDDLQTQQASLQSLLESAEQKTGALEQELQQTSGRLKDKQQQAELLQVFRTWLLAMHPLT